LKSKSIIIMDLYCRIWDKWNNNYLPPWLMVPGCSMPHSQGLADNPYPEPNQFHLSVEFWGPVWCFRTNVYLQCTVVSFKPNPQAGGPLLLGFARLLIQYICIYPRYLEVYSPIRNPRRRAIPWWEKATNGNGTALKDHYTDNITYVKDCNALLEPI
jgi:hypothetical protein